MADIKEQAAKIIGPLTGVATTWAVDLALRKGVLAFLARNGPASAEEVAKALSLDPTYTKVLLRSCYAGEILNADAEGYRLAEHMETILLNPDSPAYLGGAVKVFVALRETHLDLRTFIETGETEWWSDFDHE